MKVSFKTPDVLDYALEDIPEDDREAIKKKLAEWIEYGEYVTINFDLEKGTATVCTVRK